MHAYAGMIEAGAESKGEQFLFLERGAHRDRAIVERDIMPAEEPFGGGDEVVGERTAFKVDGEHCAAGHGPKIAEELNYLLIGEVMQEERAENEVEAARGEGQQKRVGCQLGLRGFFEVDAFIIQRRYGGAGIAAPEDGAHVTRCCPDVEHREAIVRGMDKFGHDAPQDGMAAEIAVDTDEVAKIVTRHLRTGMVQQFGHNDALVTNRHVLMIRCG